MTGLAAHYSARDIESRILAAIRAAGLDPEQRLSAVQLGPLAGHAQTTIAPVQQTQEQRVLATEDEDVAAEVNRDEPTPRRLVDDRS